MHKAAFIRVAVTVEGEDEPAHDFGQTAIEAVRASVQLKPPASYNNLKMTIARIYEDSTPPEDEGTDTPAPAGSDNPVLTSPAAAPSTTARRPRNTLKRRPTRKAKRK